VLIPFFLVRDIYIYIYIYIYINRKRNTRSLLSRMRRVINNIPSAFSSSTRDGDSMHGGARGGGR